MQSQEFRSVVLKWLKNEPEAVSVTAVESDGTNWAGNTVDGFYGQFSVNIIWRDQRGAETGLRDRYYSAEGEDLKSLWDWVVNNAQFTPDA